MKLYTKEMFLIAAEKCEVSIIDAKHILQYIDQYVTPIELPKDKEIMRLAIKYRLGDAWAKGAIWIKNYIKRVKA